MNNVQTIIRAAELAATGSAFAAWKAAELSYIQQKIALDKSEKTWVKLHQLQYALYELQSEREETP